MPKTAVIHDWLTVYGGAERVLEQLLFLYPEADLFVVCDFLPKSERGFLAGRVPRTTFIQRLPLARKHYRSYLPLMPLAIEQLDLSAYDLVISSSHTVAKGVLTGPNQLHISYIHSPMRYAWDLQHQYLRESGLAHGPKSWVARWLLHRMRLWDARTANGVDCFVANSDFIARRIQKTYRRESVVIHPPVDTEVFTLCKDKADYYLTASRLVPYKRVDLIVEAFTKRPDRYLKVVGEGPERTKIERIAAGYPNIEILGRCESQAMPALMGRARAFVFAAEEDFGIVLIEAQASGTPVIALGRGGALETVRGLNTPQPTGVFFEAQAPDSLIDAIDCFERERIAPGACRANAERFSVYTFRRAFSALVAREWAGFESISP